MATIRLATAAVVRSFQTLTKALSESTSSLAQLVDSSALEDEIGRFRVWSGNLGALQKGHSSADYRLRDSPLLAGNTLKLLKELNENISQSVAVVLGQRLPYEQQEKSADSDAEEDDGFYSEDSDSDSDSGAPKTELGQRFREIVDIIDNLYHLAVRIRQPTLKTRSLKAASYRPKDPETGVDILEQYAVFDLQHTRELVAHLRAEHEPAASLENDVLVERLSRAVTLRRRQFKYWRRHRDKLGNASIDDGHQDVAPAVSRPVDIQRHDTLDVNPDVPVMTLPRATLSQKTGKTLLSGTEATQHHQSLDDIVDTKSVTSYATTVRDLSGKGIDLPPPPKAADGERDFECPYCFIICPARYGKGRAWRTHLLQDLQPYMCTYSHCESGERLFRSRREWSEHEASHRKAWRCPEHPHAVYQSRGGLEDHLRKEHTDSFPEQQLDSIVRVGETSTIDTRDKCPICFTASAAVEGLGGLQNHIAHHLERLASFSLPRTAAEDDSDAGGSMASGGASAMSNSSQDLSEDLSEISFHSLRSRKSDQATAEMLVPALSSEGAGPSTGNALSAESLSNIPDNSQNRLDILLPDNAKDQPVPSDTKRAVAFETPVDKLLSAERTLIQSILNTVCKAVKDYTDQNLLSEPTRRACCDFFADLPWSNRPTTYAEATSNTVCMKYIEGKVNGEEYLTLQQFRDDISIMCANCRIFNASDMIAVLHADRIEDLCLNLIRQATEDPANQPEIQAIDDHPEEDTSSDSSIQSGNDERLLSDTDPAAALISLSNIPTISDMYKSQELLEKSQEQSANPPFEPNASWNKIISVVTHDIAKLRVDCIVNSANREMKNTRMHTTLNRYIHQAAGPQLRKECKKFGKVPTGEVRLTKGYALPANFVIHASRPQYQSSGGYESLVQCYRNSLCTARDHGLMSIAFPCLGAGGCGFPAHTAAELALREVRRFLENNLDVVFTRIIFCMYNKTDVEYYKDLLPVYFPPCQDEKQTPGSYTLSDYSAVIRSLQDARIEADRIWDILREFAHKHDLSEVMQLPYCSKTLSKISNNLRGLHFLFYEAEKPSPKVSSQALSDFELLSASLKLTTGAITEMITQTTPAPGSSLLASSLSAKKSWDTYNQFMLSRYEMDVEKLLGTFADFTLKLSMQVNDQAYKPGEGPDNLTSQRDKLTKYRRKQTGDTEKRSLEFFDEVLYARDFQQKSTITDAPTEPIHVETIPTLVQLYQLGQLEFTPTDVTPSQRGLMTVGFVRADITRLHVDVLVNSTSRVFGATGSLDKLVFRKAGKRIVEDCKQFGICKEGDVRVTKGYNLPAKYVVHVIPMEVYGDRAKNILRTLYQKALQEASDLKATSIAFPAIGTGALCYPVDHSTSIAVQEVRKFLDTAPATNTIKNIVFCVYGTPEERTYKSFLPVFFPPLGGTPSKKPPVNVAGDAIDDSKDDTKDGSQDGMQMNRELSEDGPIRTISEEEERALDAFESHAEECPTCVDIFKLYSDNEDLCRDGYAAAQTILRRLYMNKTGDVFSTMFEDGKRVKVLIPGENVHCWKLLVIVEKSFRDTQRTRPFVSANQPYTTIFRDVNEEEVPAENPMGRVDVAMPPNLDDATRAVWNRALTEANTAAELEQKDSMGAISAYTSAVQLLDRVASRVATQQHIHSLRVMRNRYTTRIEQLRDKPVFAGIFTRVGDVLKPFAKGEFTIDVYPGKVQVFDDALDLVKPAMILELDLNPDTALIKSKDADIAIRTRVNFHSPSHEPVGKDDIVFRCQDKADCDRLFKKLKDARRPEADVPREDWTVRMGTHTFIYQIEAYSASPDGGATPAPGKWMTAHPRLLIKPGMLEMRTTASLPTGDFDQFALYLTPETYAKVTTPADAKEPRYIFVGRTYMPFHSLTIKCRDMSQTEEVAEAITKAAQRPKPGYEESAEESLAKTVDEETERMIFEMQRASTEELERERAFVKKRARENAERRAREAESEETRKKDARLREAEREAEEYEEKRRAEGLDEIGLPIKKVFGENAPALPSTSIWTSVPGRPYPPSSRQKLPDKGPPDTRPVFGIPADEISIGGMALKPASVTKEFFTRMEQVLGILRERRPAEVTYADVAFELGIEDFEAAGLAKYLADLEFIQIIGNDRIKSMSGVRRNPKDMLNEDLDLEAPEADPKPRRLSKVAQRLLFLLGPLQPNTRLGFNFVIARENELRREDVDRAMQELKNIGITYQSRADPELWYTSQDVETGLRLVQLPEGVPALNEEEKVLATDLLKFREHGIFDAKAIALGLGIEGKQGVNLDNILEHLRSLGLVSRTYVENGNHLWSIVRDPGEQPRRTDVSTYAPTYVKVHKQHLDIDTLVYYNIPYEIDRADPNYIIVLREMKTDETEILFEHTRHLRAVPRMEGLTGSREWSSSLDTFDRTKGPEENLPDKMRKGKAPAIIQQDKPTSPTSMAEDSETAASKVHFEDDEVTFPRPISPDYEQSNPIPPGEHWTKINRGLVNSQALQEAGERFEERGGDFVVLRVLTREEIQQLAERTAEIRNAYSSFYTESAGDEERGEPQFKKKGKKRATANREEPESSSEEARRRPWRRSRVTAKEFGKKASDRTLEKED